MKSDAELADKGVEGFVGIPLTGRRKGFQKQTTRGLHVNASSVESEIERDSEDLLHARGKHARFAKLGIPGGMGDDHRRVRNIQEQDTFRWGVG